MPNKIRIIHLYPSWNSSEKDNDLRTSLETTSCTTSSLLTPIWFHPKQALDSLAKHVSGTNRGFSRVVVEYAGPTGSGTLFAIFMIINYSAQHGLSIEEASSRICEGFRTHLRNNTRTFCTSMRVYGSREGNSTCADTTIVVAPVGSNGACEIPLTEEETNAIIEHSHGRALPWQQRVFRNCPRLVVVVALCVLLGTLVIWALGSITPNREPEFPDKEQLLTPNVLAEWEKTHDWSDYYLRLDSGEIARKDLAYEKEWKIQEWYINNAASNETLALWHSGDYLQPSKWPEVVNSPQLHFSHCVARVWRYIKAQQTKKPACSADLSTEHVLHCIDDILDEFAFPPNASDMKDIEHKSTLLHWKTKFCLD